jgi:hypothetical protein
MNTEQTGRDLPGRTRPSKWQKVKVIGFESRVAGVTAKESLVFGERGLDGCRHMGCGAFVPLR